MSSINALIRLSGTGGAALNSVMILTPPTLFSSPVGQRFTLVSPRCFLSYHSRRPVVHGM